MAGAAVLFSAALAYYIRRTTVGASPAFLVISVAVLAVLPILFKNVFGLREHIVVAGLWPYLILRVSDPNSKRIGRPLRAILGLWIGFTLLFKYLYSMVVVLVELADAGLQRKPSSLSNRERRGWFRRFPLPVLMAGSRSSTARNIWRYVQRYRCCAG